MMRHGQIALHRFNSRDIEGVGIGTPSLDRIHFEARGHRSREYDEKRGGLHCAVARGNDGGR